MGELLETVSPVAHILASESVSEGAEEQVLGLQHLVPAYKGTVASLPDEQDHHPDTIISNLVQSVLVQKKQIFNTGKKVPFDSDDYTLISGDIFDTGYLLLESAMAAIPSINTLGLSAVSSSFGIVGGLINVGVGIVCLKSAVKAQANKDNLAAKRLFLDGVFMVLIGIVMLLTSISSLLAKVGISTAIGAFFATNPWILPVLFLIVTIPVLIEILIRTGKIWTNKDVGSQLHLKNIQQILKADEGPQEGKIKAVFAQMKQVFNIEDYRIENITDNDIQEVQKNLKHEEKPQDVEKVKQMAQMQKLIAKMEQLQAEIGVQGALKAFGLISLLLKIQNSAQTDSTDDTKKQALEKQALKKITALQREISKWNVLQHVRLAQQLLYVVAFPVSLAALAPAASHMIEAVENLAMALANGIPLGFDLKRRSGIGNTPIIYPKVELQDLFNI